MAKEKLSVGDLVRNALLKVAEATDAVKLTGKTEALFASAKGANQDAISELQNADKPLLAVVGKEGKVDLVTLAPAGFERIASDIPEEKIGLVAKRVASAIPAAARIDFVGTDYGDCRAGVQALRAGAAAADCGIIRGQGNRKKDLAEQEPRSATGVDEHRVLAEPADSRALGDLPLQYRPGIDITSALGIRHLLSNPSQHLL